MKYVSDYPIFAVTADIALFTRQPTGAAELLVLLIRRAQEPGRGQLALPGGFVDIDEELKAAALRELEEETGVQGVDLHQLAAYGAPDRDPRGRTVSVTYVGEVTADEAAQLTVRAGDDAAEAAWWSVSDILADDAGEALAFDHRVILSDARDRLFPDQARAGAAE